MTSSLASTALLLATALALAGCGDDDGGTSATSNGSTASESSSDGSSSSTLTSTESSEGSTSESTGGSSEGSSSSEGSTAGESSEGSSSESTGGSACGAEQPLESWPTDGLLIAFTAVGEHARVWITNPETIDYVDAWLVKPDVPIGIPGGPTELDGTFNPGYSYRLVPAEVEFGEVWTEVCDAAPCYIEDDPQAWFENPNDWCPWGFELVTIHDCRDGDGSSCTLAYP